jgi:hypothetical protein
MTTTATKTPKKKRARRTHEQIIADLEAKIEAVRTRAAKKEVKASPTGKALLTAIKALDKAIEAAEAEGDTEMLRALEAGRAPLATQLVERGLRLPDAKSRRGGRRGKEAVA